MRALEQPCRSIDFDFVCVCICSFDHAGVYFLTLSDFGCTDFYLSLNNLDHAGVYVT